MGEITSPSLILRRLQSGNLAFYRCFCGCAWCGDRLRVVSERLPSRAGLVRLPRDFPTLLGIGRGQNKFCKFRRAVRSRAMKANVGTKIILLELTFLFALLLALPVPFSAQTTTDNALTNADIARMVKAGVPESIIVREIQMSRTDLGTSPAALIELRKQGASEAVLGAVLDSRMGTGRAQSEQTTPPHVSVQPAGPHHLPTFEAKMKINATTNGKLSMSHNQIKVEKSGVPLFTLKWKETDPKTTK